MSKLTKNEEIFLNRVALKMKSMGFDNPETLEQDMVTAMQAVLDDDKKLWLLSVTVPDAYSAICSDITKSVYNTINAQAAI